MLELTHLNRAGFGDTRTATQRNWEIINFASHMMSELHWSETGSEREREKERIKSEIKSVQIGFSD